jgi:hypothetical protein
MRNPTGKSSGITMRKAVRSSRSFTIDPSIFEYLQRTRSHGSRSERVNELLHRAILQEQYEALEREAAEFYPQAGKRDRSETRAFSRATQRTLARERE